MAVATLTFADRLAAEVERKRSQLVVGLDPNPDLLPVEVRRGGRGIFLLVRTSNSGGDLQDVILKDGRPMWHHVAELVEEWGEDSTGDVGLSSVGAVVGATHPRAVAEARRLMPRTILLLP